MEEFTTEELNLIYQLTSTSKISLKDKEKAESISAKIIFELDSRKADLWDEVEEE